MQPTVQLQKSGSPLPVDRAFSFHEALELKVSRHELRALVGEGMVRRLVRGLYAVADLELSVLMRARGLSLVVPPGSVVTDETAAWLHGVDLLDHRDGKAPPLHVFRVNGHTRLRITDLRSGTRMFAARDLMRVEDILVTTPLRTAIDLGRGRWPDIALAALDGLLRTGSFTKEDIERELPRFKGFRGVVQLRALAPLADPRAESPAESKVRFEWLACADVPKPQLQIEVESPFSSSRWRIDLGVEELRYGVEYDGEEYHSDLRQREADRRKRTFLRDELGWTIDVLEKADVYGRTANPMAIVRAGLRQARLNLGRPSDPWRWPDGSGLPRLRDHHR